jgi:hypothetical protein
MKGGAENRKKTILAGGLGAGALIAVFLIYSELFGGSTPPPPQKPVIRDESPAGNAKSTSGGQKNTPGGAAAGVDAEKLASTSASLDPTLDESAMLRTESLMYSGTGRNIFSANYVPPPPLIPKVVGRVRQNQNAPPLPPPMPAGPPPPPPINLKFFGTAKQVKQGTLQAFLLSGDDVYLAGQGDIVARRYKVGTISENSVQVTDLQNNNTQTLPKMN